MGDFWDRPWEHGGQPQGPLPCSTPPLPLRDLRGGVRTAGSHKGPYAISDAIPKNLFFNLALINNVVHPWEYRGCLAWQAYQACQAYLPWEHWPD